MAFLTGWNYRKKITLTGQTGAGTDYQVKLLVGESSGATGENFDVAGHSASFPTGEDVSGDLRFTASDGTTLLPFWVESVSGTTPNRLATVWVKVSADLGTNQDIYCYYSGTTTNVSSGENTFPLFDKFTSNPIGSTWIVESGGNWEYSSSDGIRNYITSNNKGIVNNEFSFLHGYRIKAKVKLTTWENNIVIKISSSDYYQLYIHDDFNSLRINRGATLLDEVSQTITPGETHTIEFASLNGAVYSWFDGNIKSNGATDSSPLTGSGYIKLESYRNYSDNGWYDDILVRKWIATEPSYNTAGSEEIPISGSSKFFQLF